MAKNILFYFTFFIFIYGCNSNGMQEFQDDLVVPELTTKELGFINKLQKSGYKKIQIDAPIIGNVGYGESSYVISMECPFNQNIKNRDSIKEVNKEIAINIFYNIIEDSIQQDICEMIVTFLMKNEKGNFSRFSKVYSKNELYYSR